MTQTEFITSRAPVYARQIVDWGYTPHIEDIEGHCDIRSGGALSYTALGKLCASVVHILRTQYGVNVHTN